MTKSFHTCPECELRQETYTVLFRMRNPHDNSKGDTYSDSTNAWVNISAHETMADLIDTIVHESIHVAMKREDMNIDAEHNLMKHMAWSGEDWL